jgi:DNA-binding MarR family transcriptional regulator
MGGKLQKEIGKIGPFASLEEEATLNLLRTADRLMGLCESALKPAGITPTQYNVLRILRGVSPQGIACQEIARRMITRDADLTRLLDRLEARGLVRRDRQTDDRRVVHILITETGLGLLAGLDSTTTKMNQTIFEFLERESVATLVELLERVRERVESANHPLTEKTTTIL